MRRWLGRYAEIDTYRYANQLPLRAGADALSVNWVELTTTREDSGEIVYKNAWITDFTISDTTVEAIVRDGRARWKVENENNNILKTKGYHLEHNFGHGQTHLAAVLLSLNLLAFLFHTVLALVDAQYRAIRQKLGPTPDLLSGFGCPSALFRSFPPGMKSWISCSKVSNWIPDDPACFPTYLSDPLRAWLPTAAIFVSPARPLL